MQELLDHMTGLLSFHYTTLAKQPDITDEERQHWEQASKLLNEWIESTAEQEVEVYDYDPDDLPTPTGTDGCVYDWIPEEGHYERHDGFVPSEQGIYMQLKGELVFHCKFPPGLPHTWPFPDGYWHGGLAADGTVILFVD